MTTEQARKKLILDALTAIPMRFIRRDYYRMTALEYWGHAPTPGYVTNPFRIGESIPTGKHIRAILVTRKLPV